MIRTLRNSGFGQIFLGGIVVAIILAFVFTGVQPGSSSEAGECAVEVGKECVGPKEFQAALRLVTSIGINDSAIKRLQLNEQVGRGLAEREVLFKEASRLGLGTSEDDVDAEILEGRTRVSLPVQDSERLALSLALCVDGPTGCAPGTVGLRAINVRQDGEFDFDLYQRTVRVVTGRSPNHFKQMQRKELTAERLRGLIRSQVRVSPEEAYLAYSRARSKATGRTTSIKKSWFERYVTAPSPASIEAWAKDHSEEISLLTKETAEKWQLGCAVVSEIRLSSADPGSDEAADVKKSAQSLQQKAKSNTNFEELARTTSDADSAALGGRVGCLDSSYGAGAAALIDAAAALKKEGTVSPVVESIRGFHILKLTAYITPENKEALAREFATYKLASAALAEEAARRFAEQLIKRAESGALLSDAQAALIDETLADTPFDGDESPAKKADDRPQSDITREISIEQDPIPGALPEEMAAIALFGLEKENDVVKKPIVTRDGFAVLQLKSKDMITREKFQEQRGEIMAQLQKRKAEQALASYVESLLKKAGPVQLNPKFIPPKGSDDEPKEIDS